MMQKFYTNLARMIVNFAPDDFHYFEFKKIWDYGGSSKSTTPKFLNSKNEYIYCWSDVPEEKDMLWNHLAAYFNKITDVLRDIEAYHRGGVRPNIFIFSLFSDGHHSGKWLYDQDVVIQEKADLHVLVDEGEMTEEDYQEWLKEGEAYDNQLVLELPEFPDPDPELYLDPVNAYRRRRAAAIAAGEVEEPSEAEESYTDGELLDLIIKTAEEACPHDDWQEVVVETEVSRDQYGRTRIGIQFFLRTPSEELQTISPTAPVAAMNAAELLQKQMFEDEEAKEPWRKLRIRYQKGANSVQLDYDPDEPLQ